MTIETFLAPDEYGGRGLFAAEPVRKGDIVWRYEESMTRLITVEDYVAALAAGGDQAENLRKYSYPCYLGGKRFLMHDLDNGSYMNHSDDPNVGMINDPAHPHHGERETLNIALRDIAKGEQLTCDYFEFVEGRLEEWQGMETSMQFLIDMGHPRAHAHKVAS